MNTKLIYIANVRIPTEKAHGFQICKMCEEFASTGIEVELWVPTRRNQLKKNAFAFYNLAENFKINKIPCFDFLGWAKYLGWLAFYLQTLIFFNKLIWCKIDDKNAIIFSRHPEIIWLFSKKGFKTIYECHDWLGKKKRMSLYFLKRASFIVTTNNHIKNSFLENGFSSQNILVAPNGIDLNIFDLPLNKQEALAKLNLSEKIKNNIAEKKILLYTGSFRTMGVDKGINEILEALKVLDSNIFFAAVGGSPRDIEFYSQMASGLGVFSRVLLVGHVSQKELAVWQKTADVLLMPFPKKAHYEYFMTPLKMFEYMASQRPAIVSDLPSIREIFNEKNCLFCQPQDPEDLAEKIKFLLAHEEYAQKIAQQAYLDVQNYTWEKRAENILDFIA